MKITVNIIYKKHPLTLNISCEDKVFDSSRIENLPLEQWVFPFFAKGVQWKGLYEELKLFTGSENFTLHLDSDEASFALVKQALAGLPVKLVGSNNTVTVVYSETPVTTKLVVNGHALDIALIQNRYIDEWIHPFQVRGIRWDRIFKEIERAVGTDIYTLYFVGNQKYMSLLIENCPEKVNLFYRNAYTPNPTSTVQELESTAASASPTVKPELAPPVNMERISAATSKARETIKQSVDDTNYDVSEDKLPIKNSMLRNNILTICAICAILVLIFPFAKFSVASTVSDVAIESNVVSVSGFETMFGIKEIRVGSNNSVFGFLLLLLPIVMIVFRYIKQLKPFQKWIAVVTPLLGIIAEIITLLDIRKLCSGFIVEGGIKLKTTLGIGFLFAFIIYILAIALGLVLYHGISYPKKKKDS